MVVLSDHTQKKAMLHASSFAEVGSGEIETKEGKNGSSEIERSELMKLYNYQELRCLLKKAARYGEI